MSTHPHDGTTANLHSEDGVFHCTVTVNKDAQGVYTLRITDIEPAKQPWAVERHGEIVWRETP